MTQFNGENVPLDSENTAVEQFVPVGASAPSRGDIWRGRFQLAGVALAGVALVGAGLWAKHAQQVHDSKCDVVSTNNYAPLTVVGPAEVGPAFPGTPTDGHEYDWNIDRVVPAGVTITYLPATEETVIC